MAPVARRHRQGFSTTSGYWYVCILYLLPPAHESAKMRKSSRHETQPQETTVTEFCRNSDCQFRRSERDEFCYTVPASSPLWVGRRPRLRAETSSSAGRRLPITSASPCAPPKNWKSSANCRCGGTGRAAKPASDRPFRRAADSVWQNRYMFAACAAAAIAAGCHRYWLFSAHETPSDFRVEGRPDCDGRKRPPTLALPLSSRWTGRLTRTPKTAESSLPISTETRPCSSSTRTPRARSRARPLTAFRKTAGSGGSSPPGRPISARFEQFSPPYYVEGRREPKGRRLVSAGRHRPRAGLQLGLWHSGDWR